MNQGVLGHRSQVRPSPMPDWPNSQQPNSASRPYWWIGQIGTANTGGAITAGDLRLVPYVIHYPTPIDAISIESTGAVASSTFTGTVYGVQDPGTLVLLARTAALDTSSTGTKTGALPGKVVLPPGILFIGGLTLGANGSVRQVNAIGNGFAWTLVTPWVLDGTSSGPFHNQVPTSIKMTGLSDVRPTIRFREMVYGASSPAAAIWMRVAK